MGHEQTAGRSRPAPTMPLLTLCLAACAQAPPELVWPVPHEVRSLAAVAGAPRSLADYVRPGLGLGEPLRCVAGR